jgi:glycosyltransferase involved in cell wall biosynthesis
MIKYYLKESVIFLSTSLFEGVSNSIMEAMIAGLPVVATDVGDNSYFVKNDLRLPRSFHASNSI